MQIRVSYFAQLKSAAGIAEEVVELSEGASLLAFTEQLGARRASLRSFLDCPDAGSMVAFVNDRQRAWSDSTPLIDGDHVIFLAPMAGG